MRKSLSLTILVLLTFVLSIATAIAGNAVNLRVEKEYAITWKPTPKLVYTTTSPDGQSTHVTCKLTRLANSLLACDLSDPNGWVGRVVLDPKDQTAMGCRAYTNPGHENIICYPVVDRWSDGTKPHAEHLSGVPGTVYGVYITDSSSCSVEAREYASQHPGRIVSCNDRLLEASTAYLAEMVKKATH